MEKLKEVAEQMRLLAKKLNCFGFDKLLNEGSDGCQILEDDEDDVDFDGRLSMSAKSVFSYALFLAPALVYLYFLSSRLHNNFHSPNSFSQSFLLLIL